MINAIMETISISLDAEFGNRYNIYREEKKQGLKEPCFFLQCLNPASSSFLGKRYFRQNLFCIQYFPENRGKEREECFAVAERLFSCLECLKVKEKLVAGTKMKYKVTDGVLHFFVNYDLFVDKAAEFVPCMEEVSFETLTKG